MKFINLSVIAFLHIGDYAFEGSCDDQGVEVLRERVYATIVQV